MLANTMNPTLAARLRDPRENYNKTMQCANKRICRNRLQIGQMT